MTTSSPQFADVYDRFHVRVRRYLGRLIGDDAADDLTQEVFVKVSRNLGGFAGKSGLSTWVYRIATNAAVDRLRSASFRQSKQETPLDGLGDGGPQALDRGFEDNAHSAERQVIKNEMTECIRRFIHRLPESYRTVLILSELRDMKNRETAEALEVSLDTVKIRLHRARARLKAELEHGCDLHHDGESGLACDEKAIDDDQRT